MQTIIGSGGTIGLPIARYLKQYTDDIRLVSRHPKKVNETDTLFSMDAKDTSQVSKSIAGSDVVYVTIGFEYNLKVWQQTWPPFMQAVIDACKIHGSKLVFFDNVYMYDRTAIPHMTEDSTLNPPSKKGAVRMQLHQMIMNEVSGGQLQALIARAADFYGPENDKSLLGETVIKNLLKGKQAQVFGDVNAVHTYTYTPDAARATALLGNTADAFNQVWHVPTTTQRLTQKQWIELAAAKIGVFAGIQKVPTWMVKLLGVFVPVMREMPEMSYQFETDYVLDSSKFEKRFGMSATEPAEGLKMMIEDMKQRKV